MDANVNAATALDTATVQAFVDSLGTNSEDVAQDPDETDLDIDVSALRLWKLRFFECGLALRISEKMKRTSGMAKPDSWDLQAFKVRCFLKDPSEFGD